MMRPIFQGSLLLSLFAGVMFAAPSVGVAYDSTAQGTWTTDDGELTGTWQASFDVVGEALGGVITVTELPGVSTGAISGSMGGGTITFDVSKSGQDVASFNGSVTGSSVTGTLTTPNGVSGRWVGVKRAGSVATVPSAN